ncbi:hypothetical protein [Lactobacillus sp. ESL0681]|uniref:hypothetical protein n=1 Tax=Lactobacillus sp. ESL0681 TaxID=2983211 RepID=UPI0023F82A89|nr:hypothetical protein [Lactobacillus sp. ESL0681]WEV40454.1 hypothetical protein OZX59_00635 [Lactobacillus sp. ESL0681]
MKNKFRKLLLLGTIVASIVGINSCVSIYAKANSKPNVTVKKVRSKKLTAFPKKMRGSWYSYVDDKLDKIAITKNKVSLKNGTYFTLNKKVKKSQGKHHFISTTNEKIEDAVYEETENKYIATKEGKKQRNAYRADKYEGHPVLLVTNLNNADFTQNYFKSKKLAKQYTKTHYELATITLPKGYTTENIREAMRNDGKFNAEFFQALKKGVKENDFNRTVAAESPADEKLIVNPGKLTVKEQTILNEYVLRLINDARSQLKLKPWLTSMGTEKLADDIAARYNAGNKDLYDDDPDFIIEAGKANGLNLTDGSVDAVLGRGATGMDQISMTTLKKIIYEQIKADIFGFQATDMSTEGGIKYGNLGLAWRPVDFALQANDENNYNFASQYPSFFLNITSDNQDDDYSYFSFRLTTVKNMPAPTYQFHYVSLPESLLKNSKINVGFKP